MRHFPFARPPGTPGQLYASLGPIVLVIGRLGAAEAAPHPDLPLALRGVDPRRVSAGVYSSLVGSGAYGPVISTPMPDAAGLAPSGGIKGTPPAVLDARVSPNLRLGADPAALSPNNVQQAEPYVFRSIANPNLVLATFQEGRFGGSEGGAADGGYALSTDGGFT